MQTTSSLPSPTGAAARVTARVSSLTRLMLEQLLWLALVAVAAVTRTWDLGSRALMHDESLHTYFSWLLYDGQGYSHDPLMHGPFLFHVTALTYLLLGDSEAAARLPVAVAGVLLVASPWLLRGRDHLGRWGALAAGAFLLLSPTALYYTRFIRHDPFTALGTLLLVVSLFGYIERPERRWLLLGGGTLALLFTNHEIAFAIVPLLAGLLAIGLLAGPLRPLVLPLGAGLALATGAIVAWRVAPGALGGPLPAIPWDSSGPPELRPTPANQRAFYGALIGHPLTLALLASVSATVGGAWLTVRRLTLPAARLPGPDGRPVGWVAVRLGPCPDGTIGAAVREAWRDRTGLLLALTIAVAVPVALYTTLFTNPAGLATGTIATDGSLLYWLGQQDVQRGGQPWFYFLTLAPQYEPVALLLGLPVIPLALVRAIGCRVGRRPWTPRLTFVMVLAGWATGMGAALSHAGEKMPWLLLHIVLPLLLMAAVLVDVSLGRATADHRASPWRRQIPLVLTLSLLATAAAWFLVGARLTAPVIEGAGRTASREIGAAARDAWWLLAIPPLVAVALVGLAAWLGGLSRAARGGLAATLVLALLFQVHAGARLSFADGDVARDGLIYNTTTPDVTRLASDLAGLSLLTTGDLGLAIQFGDDVDWPLYWYLRDFPGAYRSMDVRPGSDVPVLILPTTDDPGLAGYERTREFRRALAATHTEQVYVLRWHENESRIYRSFAIAPEIGPGRSAWRAASDPHGPLAILGSIWSSVRSAATPAGQQRLFRLVMYREMPAPTIDFTFSVFVRNDLVPLYGTVHRDGAP